MKKFFRWLVAIPVIVLVIVFAVANRQWVTVSLDPFSSATPAIALHMPLWALLFCGIFIGLVVGWSGCWWVQGKWRRALKEARRELSRQHLTGHVNPDLLRRQNDREQDHLPVALTP